MFTELGLRDVGGQALDKNSGSRHDCDYEEENVVR